MEFGGKIMSIWEFPNSHMCIWRPFCFYANKVCIAHWGIVNNELSYFKGGLAYGHKHKVSFLLQVNSNHNSNMI